MIHTIFLRHVALGILGCGLLLTGMLMPAEAVADDDARAQSLQQALQEIEDATQPIRTRYRFVRQGAQPKVEEAEVEQPKAAPTQPPAIMIGGGRATSETQATDETAGDSAKPSQGVLILGAPSTPASATGEAEGTQTEGARKPSQGVTFLGAPADDIEDALAEEGEDGIDEPERKSSATVIGGGAAAEAAERESQALFLGQRPGEDAQTEGLPQEAVDDFWSDEDESGYEIIDAETGEVVDGINVPGYIPPTGTAETGSGPLTGQDPRDRVIPDVEDVFYIDDNASRAGRSGPENLGDFGVTEVGGGGRDRAWDVDDYVDEPADRRGRQDSFDLGSGVQEIGGALRMDDDSGYHLERESGTRSKSRSSSRRAKKQQDDYYIDYLDD